MPYIPARERYLLDVGIDFVVADIQALDPKAPDVTVHDGRLNYVITKILRKVLSLDRYHKINSAIGVLDCVKLELYRRVAGPYEDQKIAENGDV